MAIFAKPIDICVEGFCGDGPIVETPCPPPIPIKKPSKAHAFFEGTLGFGKRRIFYYVG